ncbi:hypothetical protein K7T73_21825 (plasmid) [Bacillus badius]|uniref:hypothetical protein n=1 Tax=Bacillus badius TaxID=1455 RepID=UPI001CBF973C|nr:hypothetical protein [Bacillus badius]UAT33113.1 hypothetical protein K7T73_21825 [Bacillus badius]
MKRLLGGVAAVLAVSTAIGLYINSSSEEEPNKKTIEATSKPKITVIEAKTIDYSSLEELQTELPIAVKGIKTDEKKTELQYSKVDNSLIGGHTVSNFKITEVLQNNNEAAEIKVGNNIPVMEYSFLDKESDTTYTYNGYANMRENEEYILFLLPKEEEVFPIGSTSIGKIPVEKSTEVEIYKEDFEANNDNVDDTEEVIENIEKVYEEVRAEYVE